MTSVNGISRIVPAMKLHEHPRQSLNLISSYGGGSVRIAGVDYQAPLILGPQSLHTPWIADIGALDGAALEPLWPLQPRIVLLGAAGASAAPRTLRGEFSRRSIALEPMDLGAACRTYNVLAQEDRAVAALLFP